MAGRLIVATLNLAKGGLRWGERAPLMMRQLVELRPDIIGFQEADLRIDQGNWLCCQGMVSFVAMSEPKRGMQFLSSNTNRAGAGRCVQVTRQPSSAALAGSEPPEGLVVDYLFVSDAIRVIDAWVFCDQPDSEDIALYASDHVGLAATIEVG